LLERIRKVDEMILIDGNELIRKENIPRLINYQKYNVEYPVIYPR